MHDAYTGFFLGISSVKFCFFWRWDWMWWVCIDMEEGRRRKEGRNWSERLLSVLVKYLDDKTKQQPDMCDVWVTALRSDREQVRDWVTLAVINSSQSVKVYTEMLSREMELFGFVFFLPCHMISDLSQKSNGTSHFCEGPVPRYASVFWEKGERFEKINYWR